MGKKRVECPVFSTRVLYLCLTILFGLPKDNARWSLRLHQLSVFVYLFIVKYHYSTEL